MKQSGECNKSRDAKTERTPEIVAEGKDGRYSPVTARPVSRSQRAYLQLSRLR